MRHLYTYGLLLLGMLCWSACAKEELSYPIWTVDLPTDLPLTDVHFINRDTGYACTGTLFTQGLVLQTIDQGKTWDSLRTYNTGVYSLVDNGATLIIGEGGQTIHETPLDPASATQYNQYATRNWWNWHDLVVLPSGDCLLAGGENFGRGYLHRLQGGALTLQDTFPHELRDMALGGDGTLHAVGYGAIMRSLDEGRTWTLAPILGDFFRGVDFPTAQTGYVVGEYGAVYKTTNGGADWRQCRAGTSVFANPETLLRDVAFINETEGFLVGTGGTVFWTTDGGQRWRRVGNLPSTLDYQGITIAYGQAYLYSTQGTIVGLELL